VGCQDALDLRSSKQIGWRNLHHVCSAGPPRERGWPAWFARRQLVPGDYIRDGLRGIAAPIRRPKMLAVASHLALLPAGAERSFAKTIAGTSCALDRPQRGVRIWSPGRRKLSAFDGAAQ
jgi:hypothetical protein